MNPFVLKSEFDEWAKVLEAKKAYEEDSKTILVTAKSGKLKGDGELVQKLVYERVVFQCKAGPERNSQSKGYRASATYKKNCPVKVS